MRLAVYTDYPYHRVGGRVFAERAFAIFLGRIRGSFDRLVLVGRLSPPSERARYAVGDDVELIGLPYYPSLGRPLEALPALARSLRMFWRALDGVDAVWLLGPHPAAIAFALLAAVRRRAVVLGVRQDTISYVRSRHPRRPGLHLLAAALDAAFRALARRFPVVVVGPEIAARYRRSRRLLEISVSLVDEADVIEPAVALANRSYDGELRVMSVGRLEAEKSPLLLADVLARLNDAGGPRWRLVVCGEGEMQDELAARADDLGEADRMELRGYVPFGDQLMELYRSSHVLLHLSLTEGFPQVLLEAFAAGLPVVAADVGGIRAAAGSAVCLVPPREPGAAAASLRAVAGDPALRERLVRAGHEYVRQRTAGAEAHRVAEFLHAAG